MIINRYSIAANHNFKHCHAFYDTVEIIPFFDYHLKRWETRVYFSHSNCERMIGSLRSHYPEAMTIKLLCEFGIGIFIPDTNLIF